MVQAFFEWWIGQLRELMPGWLRQQALEPAHMLVIGSEAPPNTPPHETVLAAALRRRGRETSLGRFLADDTGLGALREALAGAARPGAVMLRLPPGSLMERDVVLPLVAEQDPRRVLRYEMDRLTPFSAEEVFWSCTVGQRDRARGRLHLRLHLLVKAGVAPLLAALDAAGHSPTMIEAAGRDGRSQRLGRREEEDRGGRRGLVFAAGLCAVLALAAVLVPFLRQASAGRAVEVRIAALRPRVEQAEALRRRIAAIAADSDIIAGESARVGDPLQALAAITDAMPDDTYLTDLTLRQRKLTLDGQSAAAAKLIGELSADTTLRNVSFMAPVTRSENGKADLFSIRAETGSPPRRDTAGP